MAVGKEKRDSQKHSPIVRAIQAVERNTTGEVRVHLSKRWIEKDPFARAQKLFEKFGMQRTGQRNAVLLYVNLRRKKFAIIGDEGIHEAVGQKYWEDLSIALAQDLRTTHSENAIAMAVATIGVTLSRYFPVQTESSNPNELSDEITED